jgi:hypothetical protein
MHDAKVTKDVGRCVQRRRGMCLQTASFSVRTANASAC